MMLQKEDNADAPRYMAFNRGQEAFQLFYERLIRIKKETIRDNLFHLTTIVNTFNRHYCTGIGAANENYGLTGIITPVFMNLGLYTDQELNFHRLIAIHLYVDDTSYDVDSDGVYLVFDHPAYIEGAKANLLLDIAVQRPVFRVSLDEFSRKYYRQEIYCLVQKDVKRLYILFDKESENFFYSTPGIGNVKSIINGNHPPLFSNLPIQSTAIKNGSIGCYDPYDLYLIQGTDFFKRSSTWRVLTRYIAWNRYSRTEEKPIGDSSKFAATQNEERYQRILSFLFGINCMIYVFENFDRLSYRQSDRVSLEKDDTFDTSEIRITSNPMMTLLKKASYTTLYTKTQKKSMRQQITIINDDDTMNEYMTQYHTLNNYMNCYDAGLYKLNEIINGRATTKWYTKEKIPIDINKWTLVDSYAAEGITTIDNNDIYGPLVEKQRTILREVGGSLLSMLDQVDKLNKRL